MVNIVKNEMLIVRHLIRDGVWHNSIGKGRLSAAAGTLSKVPVNQVQAPVVMARSFKSFSTT